MMRAARRVALAFPLLALAGCENAGSDRTIGLDAAGAVRGEVYFDANGSRVRDAEDAPFAGADVRLLAPVSRDTLFRATSASDGTFLLTGVPVGTYAFVISPGSAGDSALVLGVDAATVQVSPSDTIDVIGAIGFPFVTTEEARTTVPGTRVFLRGVALNARTTFSDTLLHLADTSGTIRAMRVRPSNVVAGDSVRLRGRVGVRQGQPVLDDVTVFVVGPTFVPTAPAVTTNAAAGAAAGALDAALVRLLDAQVTDTATVGGHLTMTVNDGSGALTVRLDRAADPGFRPPFPPALFVAPNRFDIVGILVPSGPGTWQLRPRSTLDLTLR